MKTWQWVAVLVAAGTAGLLLLQGGQKARPAQVVPTTDPLISKGSKHQSVRLVQQAILKKGGFAAALIAQSGGADGIYGEGTLEALEYLKLPLSWRTSQVQTIISQIP